MSDQEWSPDVTNIGDTIAGLTLAQCVQLSEYLEEKHGIKPASQTITEMPRQDGGNPQEKAPEQTEFSVVYEGIADPAKKIALIKVFREITGLALKEAKDAVEAGNKTVKEALPKPEAEALKAKLEDAGGKVVLK